MHIGVVNKWLLVGGQDLVLEAADHLLKCSQKFHIVTARRNLQEVCSNGKTFVQNLNLKSYEYHISEDINKDKIVKSLIDSETILLSLSSPWIFRENFINLFNKNKIINLHEANLPSNRGGATLSWIIMMSQKDSASVLHLVTKGIDEGDIVASYKYSFPKICKIPKDYADYILDKSVDLIKNFIDRIISNHNFEVITQSNQESSYWPRLNTEMQGFINWDWDVKFIAKFIDAFDDPYPGSRTFIKGKKVIIKKAFFSDGKEFHPFQSGLIYKIHDNKIHISCLGGELIVCEITDENNNLIFDDIKLGDRLYTPHEYIENSLSIRPVYSSRGIEKKGV